jgi:hypothetical protein
MVLKEVADDNNIPEDLFFFLHSPINYFFSFSFFFSFPFYFAFFFLFIFSLINLYIAINIDEENFKNCE